VDISITGLTVHFFNRTVFRADSWHWDFGDGETSTERSPTHNYAFFGHYVVTLIADCGGTISTATRSLILSATIVDIQLRYNGIQYASSQPLFLGEFFRKSLADIDLHIATVGGLNLLESVSVPSGMTLLETYNNGVLTDLPFYTSPAGSVIRIRIESSVLTTGRSGTVQIVNSLGTFLVPCTWIISDITMRPRVRSSYSVASSVLRSIVTNAGTFGSQVDSSYSIPSTTLRDVIVASGTYPAQISQSYFIPSTVLRTVLITTGTISSGTIPSSYSIPSSELKIVLKDTGTKVAMVRSSYSIVSTSLL
jgi:PKD repeat protein